MEQQIRFCTSADGTRIAYAAYGERRDVPLLIIHGWPWFQESWWAFASTRSLYEQICRRRWIVAFDRRGVGSSDRDIGELSLEADVADLSAVVDHLHIERFDVMAWQPPVLAVAYAVCRPERVSKMVLWSPCARADEVLMSRQDIIAVIRTSWSLARRAMASGIYPSGPVSVQRWWSDSLRDGVSPEVAIRYFEYEAKANITDLLPRVQAPTLVLHLTRDRTVPGSVSRAVAAVLPDARFVSLDADHATLYDETQRASILQMINDFLDEGRKPAGVTPSAGSATAFQTILFTDIEGSTALTERLGDAKARDILREHERTVREALAAHGGSEIKTMGDGFMASFGSATKALECAVAIQKAFDSPPLPRTGEGPGVRDLRVRIGLNAGEPVAERGDLFGTAVNLAARIAAQAQGGEILVSDVVRQLVAGKGFAFEDRGDAALKGFDEPVRLYEVRWRGKSLNGE